MTVPYHLRHTFGTALVLGLFATRNAALHNVATRILGSGYQKRITDILHAPEGWPFGIDAIAALMGQVDITSLLNTYSHGSSFVTAAWCKPWQHANSITDLRLAAMMGPERSTITKLRQRLGISQGGAKANWQDLVLHLVCKPTADDEPTPQQENLETKGHAFELDWEIVQRLLIDQLQSEKSLEEMAAYAARIFRIPPEIAGKILRRYRELIAATEMDDFEPPTSELLRPVASHNKGVERGKLERDGFIATTQKWRQRNPSQRDKFSGFIKRWQATVDAQDPRVVCTDQDELEQTIFVLQALGADRSQLIIQTHGDPHDRWLEHVKSKNLEAKHVDIRASRGGKRARVIEKSIGIRQKTQVSNQKFPDGRDFHRALIVISLAMAVENS